MADKLTREKRSWNMSRIRRKNTEIEIKVRKYLFSQGFRFRKNVADMPGKPDIVLSKYKTIIFIHGCYWHRHASCKNCTTPNTNREFWLKKFEKNMQNDSKHQQELEAAGWKVLILWECEIENDFERLMDNLVVELQRPAQPG
ncbi:MAG: very short patch repair endonuclease [Faecalispora jeddahensis]|jgi:DNA mismatch endonuclease vsr